MAWTQQSNHLCAVPMRLYVFYNHTDQKAQQRRFMHTIIKPNHPPGLTGDYFCKRISNASHSLQTFCNLLINLELLIMRSTYVIKSGN